MNKNEERNQPFFFPATECSLQRLVKVFLSLGSHTHNGDVAAVLFRVSNILKLDFSTIEKEDFS